ncbi:MULTISPECIES: OprD family porin [Pseudomonas]|uniref:OprD family porin n=1 Tax=Pseudomonas TaxID=286 RepID=UPI000CFF4D75|nr:MULTISPECIES: OprD family porin [Pseudomonas]PRA51983.1 outer membrane porin, OprD family [Pseudomonas sp. MYb115]QXN51359.1 OprD family porin [Pseudomonas fluorescens]WSO25676.1 OprD family porin [Pseudomonas fluorescens]
MSRAIYIAVLASVFFSIDTTMADGFIADSKIHLEARNFYYNGDYRQGAGVSKKEEWAQGFLLNYESGYTPGVIGFGADALIFAGYKLDSSPDRTGSGLLPKRASGEAADEYSKAGYVAKLKISETSLRYGMSLPKVPVLQYNNSRLLPQTFQGWQISSTDIDRLTINLAQFNKTITPDSTDLQDISLAVKDGRYRATGIGDYYRYGGGAYKLTPELSATYFYGELDDVYRQQFAGLVHSTRIGKGTLTTDLRAFASSDVGAAKAGDVDNRAYAAALSYAVGNGHSVMAAYQVMEGATGFPYVNNPYLPNYVQYHDFGSAGERSWQLRYGYDFAAMGIPGLSFFTAYTHGDGLKKVGTEKEWERDIDVSYAFQGSLKGFSVRLRNATYRSDDARDIDETRLIATYLFTSF